MKAAVLHGPGDLRYEDVPDPAPGPGEVLVRVRLASVCGSDIYRITGPGGAYHYPLIPGHEFSGEVVGAGRDGQRVTVIPLIPCRQCEPCERGQYNLCDRYSYLGSRRDEGFAEYVAVPEANLLPVPDSVEFEEAATVEAAGGALHTIRRASVQPGARVAIFGAGPIGLCATQWALLLGAKQVIVVEPVERKRQLAMELGASATIDPTEGSAADMIRELTDGEGVDAALEFSGSPGGQSECIAALKKRGVAVFYGISHRGLELSPAHVDRILRHELTVRGSWNADFSATASNDWRIALDFIARGRLRTRPLITHRFPLSEAPSVFHQLAQPGHEMIKVVFEVA